MRIDPAAWLARPGIRRLLKALDAESDTCRFVGGAVRDLLLCEEPGDLDLATTHPPDETIRRLEAAGIKAIPTGIEHGTVTAVSSNTVVEVTTLRADVSTDGRRATVAFTDDWQADASRRDFTINALYAEPYTGEVHDYFHGKVDLAERTVRFIGEPLERIAEDHLRILRYFRFHARYGHGAPDPAALAACAARANDLMALSRERIADELLKLLGLADPSATVDLMKAHRLFEPVVPDHATGECCGQPFLSKGFPEEAERVGGKTRAEMDRLSDAGRCSVVTDASTCAKHMREHPGEARVADSAEFLLAEVLPKLKITQKLPAVAVHHNCSAQRLQEQQAINALAAAIAEKVVVLDAISCCGYAGDKGLFIPELNAHATRRVGNDIPDNCTLGVSTVSTCASGLTERADIPFVSLASLLEWASR